MFVTENPDRKKRLYKKSQESVIKTCQKKKKTRVKSTKEKNIKNWFSIEVLKKFFVFFLNIKNERKNTEILGLIKKNFISLKNQLN